jgi:hypothetical protein
MNPKQFNLITGKVKSEVFHNNIIDSNNELNIGYCRKKNIKHFAGQIIGKSQVFEMENKPFYLAIKRKHKH